MTASSERARGRPRQTRAAKAREPVAADVPRVAGPEAISPAEPRMTSGRSGTSAAWLSLRPKGERGVRREAT
eukprot:4963065-Alexandrium_andersonii.AAC.1